MFPSLLYLIAVICSMMSQLPFLVGTTIGTILKLSWILPLASLLFTRPADFFNKSLRPFFILLLVFAFYCFFMTAITGVTYTGSDLYNITLSFIIALISYAFWKNHSSQKFLTALGFVLMFCAVIIAYVVYNTSFIDYDLLAQQYAFDSKNSMGQILFASLLIGNVILIPKGKVIRVISIVISVYVFWVILVLKSRATFLSILFIVAYFCLKFNNKHIRRAIALICIASALWLVLNPDSWYTLYNGIILAGRDAHDLNDLSSGRITLIAKCWQQFGDHPLFGIGNEYADCFPLIILTQYGLVGATIVFGIVVYAYRRVKKPSMEVVSLLAYLVYISFLINSLFEAQPPFGPGAKCFFVWMMFGFLLADKVRNNQTLIS